MSTLTIYGASDDLVEFRGHAEGEIGCYDNPVEVIVGDAPNDAARLRFQHSGEDGWIVSVLMPEDADEDQWEPPRFIVHNYVRDSGAALPHYCPVVQFDDLPDDTPVRAFIDGEEVEIN